MADFLIVDYGLAGLTSCLNEEAVWSVGMIQGDSLPAWNQRPVREVLATASAGHVCDPSPLHHPKHCQGLLAMDLLIDFFPPLSPFPLLVLLDVRQNCFN